MNRGKIIFLGKFFFIFFIFLFCKNIAVCNAEWQGFDAGLGYVNGYFSGYNCGDGYNNTGNWSVYSNKKEYRAGEDILVSGNLSASNCANDISSLGLCFNNNPQPGRDEADMRCLFTTTYRGAGVANFGLTKIGTAPSCGSELCTVQFYTQLRCLTSNYGISHTYPYYNIKKPNDYYPQVTDRTPYNGAVKCPNRGEIPFRLGVYATDPDGATNLDTEFYWQGGNGRGTDIHMSPSWYWTYDQYWGPATYTWYATVSDGPHTYTTPTWSFTVNQNPSCSIENGPCNGNMVNTGSWRFYLRTSDPDNNINSRSIVYDGRTISSLNYDYGSARYYTDIALTPGIHSWYGQVGDNCANITCGYQCTFPVNDIPHDISTSTDSFCNRVVLKARIRHTFLSGESVTVRFNYWGGITGSKDVQLNYDNQEIPLALYPIYGNKTVYWNVVAWDTNGTSSPIVSGSPVTPNCPPYPPDNLSEFINCRNVTLRAHVSDPDGTGRNLRVVFHPTVSFSGNNIVESAISDSSPSVNLVLPFDSLFTWSVDVTDNLSTPVTTYRNVNLSTDHSPQNKTSYIIDPKNSTTYPANANPRFSIDYDKLRLQPVTINDYSYDADTLNQTIPGTYDYNQDTYKQRVQAALSLSVNGVGQGSISKVDPYQLTNGYYYHNIPLANLYAGNWSYTMQDTDACGAISGAVSGSFVIAPPAVKNVRDATGDSGCPLCGGRKTNIRIEWDEVPYITNARNTSTNPDAHLYYAEWTNNDPSRMSALCGSYLLDGKWCPVTKPSSHPDYNLGSGYVRGSSIILETDVLDLYDLSTSTPRNIHYRVRSYSNGVFSDWVVYPAVDQPAITYNCPIPGGLLIFPPTSNDPDIPLEIRADEDSTQLTAKLRCQLFKTKKWSDAYGDDLISAARSNRIYSPETNPVTFVWDPLAELDLCSSGSIIKNTPPDPGNILHAGTSTVMDSCEGTIRATVRNFGWSDVGLNELTGYRKIVIDPRATEEFNYSGEVISNPPPGFEKLDLPGVQ